MQTKFMFVVLGTHSRNVLRELRDHRDDLISDLARRIDGILLRSM